MLLTSLLGIGALLLIVSGVAKIVDPEPTIGAMRTLRLPSSKLIAAGLGTGELVVGCATLAIDGIVPPVAFATIYAAFSVVVVAALASDSPLQSCGCFGRADTPPSAIHLAMNIVFVGTGVWSALVPQVTTFDLIATDPDVGVAFVGFATLGVYVAFLLLSPLPQLRAEIRGSSR